MNADSTPTPTPGGALPGSTPDQPVPARSRADAVRDPAPGPDQAAPSTPPVPERPVSEADVLAAELAQLRTENTRLRAERADQAAEVARLRQRTGAGRRVRSALSLLLVVLTVLVATAVVPAAWARNTLADTDRWVALTAPLVDDPAVQQQLSLVITDEVFELVQPQERLTAALPEDARLLAGPLTAALRGFTQDQVLTLVASDQFASAWAEANRLAHPQIRGVLRGETETVLQQDGVVVLNLLPAVNQALQQVEPLIADLLGRDVQIPAISSAQVPEAARAELERALGVPIPADLGQIPVARTDALGEAQAAVVLANQALVALLVLVPLLALAAILIAPDRRRTILQLLTGLLIGLVLVRLALRFSVDQLATNPPADPLVAATTRVLGEQILVDYLARTAPFAFAALALVVLMVLFGPYRWAVLLRRGAGGLLGTGAHAFARTPAAAWIRSSLGIFQLAGLVVGLVALLLAGSLVTALVILVVLGLYQLTLWWLGRQAGTEPPAAEPPATEPSDAGGSGAEPSGAALPGSSRSDADLPGTGPSREETPSAAGAGATSGTAG